MFDRRAATTTSDKSVTIASSRKPRHDLSPRTSTAPENDAPEVARQQPAQHQRVRDAEQFQPAAYHEDQAPPAGRTSRRRRPATPPRPADRGSPRQKSPPRSGIHFDREETLPGRHADDDRISWRGLDANTSYSRQTRHRYQDDLSPRLNAASFVYAGDAPEVRQQQPVQHQRVRDSERPQPESYHQDPAGRVRRPIRRRGSVTSPRQDGGVGSPRQQPQPITSIHFHSGEIDSTPPGRDTQDDGITWGLDADRCMFETTFPLRDRRGSTQSRFQALTDDEDYISDGHDRDEIEQAGQPQPLSRQQRREGLSRWRTLDDVHHSSMESVAVADDDGSGDNEDRRPPPPRDASPEFSRRRHPDTKRRSVSLPNRSVVGFYLDSDWDSTDRTWDDDETDDDDETRRDDGAGDRLSCGNGAERLELEFGSEDWLDMQREIYATHSRAEQLFDSPRRTFLRAQPDNTAVPSRISQQPVRTLTATRVAGPSVAAIVKNQVQQRSQQSAVPTRNPTSENQPAVGETNPNQVTNTSSYSVDSRVQMLLLTLFIAILLVGFIYKHTRPSAPPIPAEPPPPEASPWLLQDYFTDIFLD